MCILLLTGSSLHGEDPSLDQIKAGLLRWRNTFSTIKVVSFRWNEEATRQIHPEILPGTDFVQLYGGKCEFVWADFGACMDRNESISGGKVVRRSFHGNDGLRPWDATTKINGDPDVWESIQKWKPIPSGRLQSSVQAPLYGLWLSSHGGWLPDILGENESARLERIEEINGTSCAVVAIDDDSDSKQFFWLSPKNHWLPLQSKGYTQKKDEWLETWNWQVIEFSDFQGFHFPAKGRLSTTEQLIGDWVVLSVDLNVPLARTDFLPPAPTAGVTKVYDHVTGTFQTRALGETSSSATRTSNVANGATGEGDEMKGPSLATPSESFSLLPKMLIGGGFLLLIVGFYFKRRQSA